MTSGYDFLAVEDRSSRATQEAINALKQLGYPYQINYDKLERIIDHALESDGSICLETEHVTVYVEGYTKVYGDDYIILISGFKSD